MDHVAGKQATAPDQRKVLSNSYCDKKIFEDSQVEARSFFGRPVTSQMIFYSTVLFCLPQSRRGASRVHPEDYEEQWGPEEIAVSVSQTKTVTTQPGS
jgi:hypothetical protein